VVEEAPAPGKISRGTRERLHSAARKAAEAISYRGAGTVEFLYDEERAEFWFLEMNTRLQVEHPVTEMVFHTDLVELQIRAAQGETSEVRYPDKPDGHAIEVRLYAEDPAQDYQPQSGLLTTFEIPTSRHVRVDTGFGSGNEVSTHYDAMLAKVVAYGSDRATAARRLCDALRRARIHGLVTNRDLLVAILEDPDFLAGRVSTAFLDTFEVPTAESDPGAPVAAALALAELAGRTRTVQSGIPVAWRNVVAQPQRTEFEGDVVVEWWGGRDGYTVDGATVIAASPTAVTLETDGVRTTYDVTVAALPNGQSAVDVDSPHGHVRLARVPRFVDPADTVASGSLLAPMPGTVDRVAVETGQTVEAGQPVLVLEAMKMQHTVSAPYAGVVTEINVKTGAQVASGEVLAVVEGEEA
jgi:propionyl-CoA carboxylase alpha chain